MRIPKVYNGRDKTFFFFSWEQFLQNQNLLAGVTFSVPTPATATAISAPRLRRRATRISVPIRWAAPSSPTRFTIRSPRHVAPNGQIVTDPFVNNRIPTDRLDPVALKIQNLIPLPFCVAGPPCNATGVVNNFQNTELVKRDTEAPSLKIDQSLGPQGQAIVLLEPHA